MKVIENIQGQTLQQIVDQYFAEGARVEYDGYRSYLKTFLLGTYHGKCTKLQAYLDEFCFRFNRCMPRRSGFSSVDPGRRYILWCAELSR